MRLIDADKLMPLFVEKAHKMNNRHGVKIGESWLLDYNDIKDVIEHVPTAEPRQYILKVKPQTDIEKFKAVFSNYITPQEIEIVPLTPEGNFTIDELRAWLYEIAFNNIPSEFEKHVVEIIQRLDGFERFCKDRRGGDAHE